jgi:hypothetical protein
VPTPQSHFAHIDCTIWAFGAVDMSKCSRELAQMCRRKAILFLFSKPFCSYRLHDLGIRCGRHEQMLAKASSDVPQESYSVPTPQSHFAHIDYTIWAFGAVDMSKCSRELAQMCRRKAILC